MRCFPSLHDVPDDVALAIVAVPPEHLEAVLDDAIAKHVRGLLIVTGDLPAGSRRRDAPRPPSGDPRPGQRHPHHRAGQHGRRSRPVRTRRCGPCSRRRTSRPGGVSISLQSGPLGTGLLEMASRLGVGLASFVSLGDKADVSGNDLLQYWEDDPATSVVLIYTESFGNPRKFARIARRLSRRKPIVAVRAGGLRRSHHGGPVRAGRGDPRAHRPAAVRHRPGARRPATATRQPRDGRLQRGQPGPPGARHGAGGGLGTGRARRRRGRGAAGSAAGRLVRGGRRAAADPPGHAGRLHPRRACAAGRGRRGRARGDLRPAPAGPGRTPTRTRCWSSSRS